MRFPRILTHAFDSDSKTVSFGWALKLLSTVMYLTRPDFGAERWERMILIAALLVGGKLVKELLLEHAEIKAEAPAALEAAPNAPAPPAP